jgi:hypothetical protein
MPSTSHMCLNLVTPDRTLFHTQVSASGDHPESPTSD